VPAGAAPSLPRMPEFLGALRLSAAALLALVACHPPEEPTPGGAPPPCLASPVLAAGPGPLGPDLKPAGIALTWTDTSSCETGFELQRAQSGGAFAALASALAGATSYADTSLIAPAVGARGSGGQASDWSNTAVAPGPPPAGP